MAPGIHHVVQFSGGVTSWAAARVVKDRLMQPGDSLTLLFADTLIEDEGTYAFLQAAADDIGVPVTRISNGMDPLDVFKKERMLGNSRLDPCSKYLKRIPLRKWIEANCTPDAAVIHYGLDWTEIHRLERVRPRMEPWRCEAPLIDAGIDKEEAHKMAEQAGLPRQRLYDMGLSHANCGGGCVKAGQGHWVRLLEAFPERFTEWQEREQAMRDFLGRDVAMMVETKKGVKSPLTLAELRRRHCSQESLFDLDDIGGCGCALE